MCYYVEHFFLQMCCDGPALIKWTNRCSSNAITPCVKCLFRPSRDAVHAMHAHFSMDQDEIDALHEHSKDRVQTDVYPRQYFNTWNAAKTLKARQDLTRSEGLKPTPFIKVPNFNLFLDVSTDPAHLFNNICKNLYWKLQLFCQNAELVASIPARKQFLAKLNANVLALSAISPSKFRIQPSHIDRKSQYINVGMRDMLILFILYFPVVLPTSAEAGFTDATMVEYEKICRIIRKFSKGLSLIWKVNPYAVDVNTAEVLFDNVFSAAQELFGKSFMTFNWHMLLHFCDEVRRFGNVRSFMLFYYERLNKIAKSYNVNGHCSSQTVLTTSWKQCALANNSTTDCGLSSLYDRSDLPTSVTAIGLRAESAKAKERVAVKKVLDRIDSHRVKSAGTKIGCVEAVQKTYAQTEHDNLHAMRDKDIDRMVPQKVYFLFNLI